jgi:rare lipoprotein A
MLPRRQPSSHATSERVERGNHLWSAAFAVHRGESGLLACSAVIRREPVSSPRRPLDEDLQTLKNLLKLGAALCGLAFAAPAMAVAADTPTAPVAAASPGGLSYDDPSAPTVFADGSTLTAPLGQLVGATVTLHGVLAGSRPGDAVAVQRLDPLAGWVTATTATVAADGSYDAIWQVDKAGKTTVRAILATQAMTATRTASATAPAVQGQGRAITLYRRAKVTWYGPGFYGRRTACGKRMSRALLGVAHKTLPCGTLVDLYNNGRTVTVPVIDRGPFRPGTSYDLTAATARALGVQATTTIGAVRSVPAPVVVAAAAR